MMIKKYSKLVLWFCSGLLFLLRRCWLKTLVPCNKFGKTACDSLGVRFVASDCQSDVASAEICRDKVFQSLNQKKDILESWHHYEWLFFSVCAHLLVFENHSHSHGIPQNIAKIKNIKPKRSSSIHKSKKYPDIKILQTMIHPL